MVPNKPRDFTAPRCQHLNAQSLPTAPWSRCDDCGVQHVRAALRQDGDMIHIEAGAKRICRALVQESNIQVVSEGLGVVQVQLHADDHLSATLNGAPVTLVGL